MGWFQKLQKAAKARKDKRLAHDVWARGCVWPGTLLKDTEQPWIHGSDVYIAGVFQLTHISAYRALGRDAMVAHWVPLLGRDAIRMVHDDKHILLQWAHIENRDFWNELRFVFTQPLQPIAGMNGWDGGEGHRMHVYWQTTLEEAGRCGNLAPFDVAPQKMLLFYAHARQSVHPEVGLWLLSKGLTTWAELHALVDAAYTISGSGFGTHPVQRPVALDYTQNVVVMLLRDYQLSLNQKVGVVGQAVRAFGGETWNAHLAEVCAPFMEGIDIGIIGLLCHTEERNHAKEFDSTVWMSTQAPSNTFNPEKTERYRYNKPWPHMGLGLLLEYFPPKNRIELYFLAQRAQSAELGRTPVEVFELPLMV